MRLTLAIAVLPALLAYGPARAEQSAEDILKASGVRGGLVVHLGCGEGELTAALRTGDAFLVQGLDADPANVAKARAHFHSLGLSGAVSADVFDGRRLPYADNLVNLVVVEDLGQVATSEVMRVLCPGGVAYVKQDGKWEKNTKPWPDAIDEWTHYLHGPDNNAVAEDTVVGPPRHFQWISPPRFARSHDHLSSVSAVVSSGGRLFYIVDQGSIAFAAAAPRWRLVARDAFNGVKLWERGIAAWEYHLRDFRSGPADLARRLVAVGDRVYVTLGYDEPVSALDAATGEIVRTYAGTEGTQEIVHDDGMLLLVLGERRRDWGAQEAKQLVSQKDYFPPFDRYTPPADNKRLMAVEAESGHVAWKNAEPYARETMPSTLAASSGRVCFQNLDAVVCLDAKTGELRWKTPRSVQRRRLAWSTPTLVVHDGVVYSADRRAADTEGDVLWIPSGGYHEYIRGDVEGELIAYNAETGDRLWSCPAYEGFNAPVDVMIADGLLWTGRYAWGNDPGITEARDPKTGEVRRRRPADQEFLPRFGHARCHRAKATAEYLVLGRRGVEFVDLDTGGIVANFWVRGICQYGVMPANGLLYAPPHSCACSVDDLLKCGFIALAPGERGRGKRENGGKGESRNEEGATIAAPRLEKGPAYAEATQHSSFTIHLSADWPTYRHDAARSGATPAAVPHDLQPAWQTDLGGKLTSPVVAGGLLLVAQTDAHRVCALDAATGRELWSFTAGARIDSPPTIFHVGRSGTPSSEKDGVSLRPTGRCIFGSADGRVYCLRLEDGALVWQFRAAPQDRRIVVNGQLESPWPVSGSVLVTEGSVYFAAGRTSYLDGGMRLYKLDAATGRAINVAELAADEKKRDGGVASGGYLPDVLSSDGQSIFMRSARFGPDLSRQPDNVPHLWSPVGFLDDNWWHRTYWQISTSMGSGWGGWSKVGQRVPSGRLLVTDGSRVFGFGRNQYDTPGAHVGVDGASAWGPVARQAGRWTFYRLFGRTLGKGTGEQAETGPAWSRRVPVLVRAMVLAQQTLFAAGPADTVKDVPHEPAGADPLADALKTSRGGRLLAVSAADGKTLADYELESPPVFDGMAAAGGRLYVATKDGRVVCMGP